MRLEELTVPLRLDDTNYNEGLRRADDNTGKFAANIASKMKSVGNSLSSVGKKMTLGLTAPIVAGFGASVLSASNLEQSIGGVESVFGDAASTIAEFGRTSATQVGLSERAFNELATRSGALLQNLGFDANGAAEEMITLTGRASDMAATFGTEVDTALSAINSALKGEFNPLEQFGVKMNAASIKAKALELGLGDLEGNVDDNAKATAALAILYEQTAKTEGQFGRESETLSGQLQIQKAQLEEMGAEIGEILMPVILDIMEVVKGWMSSFKELSPEMKKGIVVVLGIVAALGPLLVIVGTVASAIGTLIPIVSAIGTFLAALAAGPVLLIIAGVAAIIAIFLLLRANWGTITAFLRKTWDGFVRGFGNAINTIKRFIQSLVDKFNKVKSAITNAIPDWLIPGSATPFEIGMKGIRKEIVKVDAEFSTRNFGQSLPNVASVTSGIDTERDVIDYERLARTLAHELQLVMG